MAVDRRTPTLANDGPTMGGEDYTDLVNEEVEALWDRTAVWLDNVAGTNTITATADPTVLAYSRNQQYNFLPVNNNTGPVTIAIDGLTAVSIRDIDGVALAADSLVAGRMTRLQHDGTNFRILNRPPDTGSDAFSEIATQVFTATGTYTPNARMIYCHAKLQAAGGGSGGADSGNASNGGVAGGGGGAGEYAEGFFSAATIGASQAVTIGAVGTAGAATGGNGGNAAASSLGSLLTCNGGSGGTGTGNSVTNAPAQFGGGAGGSGGSGGHLRIPGGPGGPGFSVANNSGATNFRAIGGIGGASILGNPVHQLVAGGDNVGIAGQNYGAGASGATDDDQTGSAGNTGGPGILVITEYLRAA